MTTTPAAAHPGTAGLPANLAANPRLSRWIRVHPGGVVSVHTGKVELGQGILTALAQIAAEELDLEPGRIRMVAANTATNPDEGVTAGSMSVQTSGAALRQVCAEVRARLLDLAAERLGVPADRLTVEDGHISRSDRPADRTTSYWELAEEPDLLERDATGVVAPKPADEYRVVGSAAARLDLPDKVSGRRRFVADLDLPGLRYGRVLRPPSPGATLSMLDDGPVRSRPGVVAVVRDGSFVGVVADREEVAVRAVADLRAAARWDERAELPDEDDLDTYLRSAPARTSVPAEQVDERAAAGVVRTLHASYLRPYVAHGSIGPSCAVARWDDVEAGHEQVSVWTHSQGIFRLRAALAEVLGMAPERLTLHHVEGSGAYGHNGADDVALDATLLARAVPGRPVLVQWSRVDEHAWEPYGPAAAITVSAGVDAAGAVLTWRHEVWSNGHLNRPGPSADGVSRLLAASDLAAGQERRQERPVALEPPLAGGGGATRNSVPGYAFPDHRVTSHILTVMPLRTSSLRALGATANVFAIESFMDELAAAAGVDPLEYRLRHLTDPRGRAVLQAAARAAGWGEAVAGAGGTDDATDTTGTTDTTGDADAAVGRGVGYARYKNSGAYCAVVAEVEAEHELRVRRLTVAVDVGLVVNPDGVKNQLEGGAIQATSWALKERVRFDRTRVTSDTWETYPILRFSEVPAVDVHILDRRDKPSLGAGEAAQGPTVAAIANALAAALGARVRTLPLTPDRILAALQQDPSD